MITLPQPTVLDSVLLKGAEAAHHSVTVISTGWSEFWNRSPEQVLAELNTDITKTTAGFSLAEKMATDSNAILDAVNDSRFPRRAPIGMPTGWAFDGSTFSYTPPADPAPEP